MPAGYTVTSKKENPLARLREPENPAFWAQVLSNGYQVTYLDPVKVSQLLFWQQIPLPYADVHSVPDMADMKFEFFGKNFGEYLPGKNKGQFTCIDST